MSLRCSLSIVTLVVFIFAVPVAWGQEATEVKDTNEDERATSTHRDPYERIEVLLLTDGALSSRDMEIRLQQEGVYIREWLAPDMVIVQLPEPIAQDVRMQQKLGIKAFYEDKISAAKIADSAELRGAEPGAIEQWNARVDWMNRPDLNDVMPDPDTPEGLALIRARDLKRYPDIGIIDPEIISFLQNFFNSAREGMGKEQGYDLISSTLDSPVRAEVQEDIDKALEELQDKDLDLSEYSFRIYKYTGDTAEVALLQEYGVVASSFKLRKEAGAWRFVDID